MINDDQISQQAVSPGQNPGYPGALQAIVNEFAAFAA
jgi:hypothetical protein